jgi:hypothetical protein
MIYPGALHNVPGFTLADPDAFVASIVGCNDVAEVTGRSIFDLESFTWREQSIRLSVTATQ